MKTNGEWSVRRRNEQCNEQLRTNRSAVDPPLDDKLAGRRRYHAGHASVAQKIGSPCKMSSDRRANDIYARGKHYDPNCQYRYMCHVISQNGIYDARTRPWQIGWLLRVFSSRKRKGVEVFVRISAL